MATKLFLRAAVSDINPGAEDERLLSLTQGSSLVSSDATATVAGPTAGVQVKLGGVVACWLSNPLFGVSIGANSVTFNLWGLESNNLANTGFDVLIEHCDRFGAVIDSIVRSERGTELGTSAAVQNWTASATARTIVDQERIKVTVFGNDVGTMGSGKTFTLDYGAGTGADGDSYVSFTETITEYGKRGQVTAVKQAVNRAASI